jgi:hypothetical protein
MPVSLDASRSFTDYRSSRIINQELKDKLGGQPIGVALWNTDFTAPSENKDNTLLKSITSPYSTEYTVQPRQPLYRK